MRRAPFAAGSDTSQEAADSLDEVVLAEQEAQVYGAVHRAEYGLTCDEAEILLRMPHQSASARLRELVLQGHLVVTPERRRTRRGRFAHVYRTRQWFEAQMAEAMRIIRMSSFVYQRGKQQ